MNRYAARGLHHAALEGRSILVLAANQVAARDAFDQVAAIATDHAEHITRANGAERIQYRNGARIMFRTHRGAGHRGIAVDTVYLDVGVDEQLGGDEVKWSSITACVDASSIGEIVRA